MVVGERLRAGRERASLTQEQVAQLLALPRELVSMWETGSRQPKAPQLEALAQLYRVSQAYLKGEVHEIETGARAALLEAAADPPARQAFETWLRFLDGWASFLEDEGDALPGPGKPPRKIDRALGVTDARRAPTLVDEVRDYYGLGRDALPNLRIFLDERGVLVYRAELGALEPDGSGIVGAYLNHAQLGSCILVNASVSPGRQAFTMAHAYAHALFHFAERWIVCRNGDTSPLERFANTFSAHFLVPRKQLRQLVANMGGPDGLDAYKVLQIALYFRVSYPTTLNRLVTEHHITEEAYERMRRYSPSALAERIGLAPEHFRDPEPASLLLDRYPVSVLSRVRSALRRGGLAPEQAARLLQVDESLLHRAFMDEPPHASVRELRQYAELPA